MRKTHCYIPMFKTENLLSVKNFSSPAVAVRPIPCFPVYRRISPLGDREDRNRGQGRLLETKRTKRRGRECFHPPSTVLDGHALMSRINHALLDCAGGPLPFFLHESVSWTDLSWCVYSYRQHGKVQQMEGKHSRELPSSLCTHSRGSGSRNGHPAFPAASTSDLRLPLARRL